VAENNPGYARPAGAQESAGLSTGDEYRYADGRKVGEVSYRFGARATVTRDMPGWFIADGTQPDLVVAGVNYGKPDLRERNLVGANVDAGGAGTFPVGATGGAVIMTMPVGTVHYDDAEIAVNPEETKHDITQPIFAPPAAHVVAGPNAHGGTPTEVTALPGSGVWVNTHATAVAAGQALPHTIPTLTNNHVAGARTTDVALTHNDPSHDGADVSVDDVAVDWSDDTPTIPYDPYIAVWPLIKIR
jgi:hypothetical protein